MKLVRLVFEQYRWPLALVLLLGIGSGLLSVGVIAFINQRMIAAQEDLGTALWQFGLMLVLLMVLASGAQLSLTALGHRFVHGLRRIMVKRLLDTDIERIEAIGGAKIFASLSSDIRSVTMAFVQLPDLIYGTVLSVAAFSYLAWLSPALFTTTLGWMLFTLAVGWLLVVRLNSHIRQLREAEDTIYQSYQAVIDGRKELALNRDRARRLYEELFDTAALKYRKHITLADRYNGLAGNWANIMVLGTIGLAFYLANGLGWASPEVAATYALTVLFMRTPLVLAVAAIPAQVTGRIALDKVESLALVTYRQGFEVAPSHICDQWQTLELRGVEYHYPRQGDEPGFNVGPVDLLLRRGETVFLMGGNGSGKSSLARLLSGLYRPCAGEILVDGKTIVGDDWLAYRRLFASVFTDFHLFSQLLGPDGQDAEADQVSGWLDHLHMRHKVSIGGGHLLDTRFSQGQRKRLALLLALLEKRGILLLDEWAADQDPLFRRFFYRELLPQFKQAGLTVFAISHDDQYFDLADRLMKMEGGRLSELRGDRRESASRDALQEIGGALAGERGEPAVNFVARN